MEQQEIYNDLKNSIVTNKEDDGSIIYLIYRLIYDYHENAPFPRFSIQYFNRPKNKFHELILIIFRSTNTNRYKYIKYIFEEGGYLSNRDTSDYIQTYLEYIIVIKFLARQKKDLLYPKSGRGKDMELVKLLIVWGADINKKEQPTLLELSIREYDFEVLNFLIENGADVNHDDGGITALRAAIYLNLSQTLTPHPDPDMPFTYTLEENIRIIKLLLEKGADPNHRNRDGVILEFIVRRSQQIIGSDGTKTSVPVSATRSISFQQRQEHLNIFIDKVIVLLIQSGADINYVPKKIRTNFNYNYYNSIVKAQTIEEIIDKSMRYKTDSRLNSINKELSKTLSEVKEISKEVLELCKFRYKLLTINDLLDVIFIYISNFDINMTYNASVPIPTLGLEVEQVSKTSEPQATTLVTEKNQDPSTNKKDKLLGMDWSPYDDKKTGNENTTVSLDTTVPLYYELYMIIQQKKKENICNDDKQLKYNLCKLLSYLIEKYNSHIDYKKDKEKFNEIYNKIKKFIKKICDKKAVIY